MTSYWEQLWAAHIVAVTPAAAGVPPTYAVGVPRLNPGNPITGNEALVPVGAAYAVGDRVLVGFLTRYGPVVILRRYR